MNWKVGLDEAGRGPVLGPLVIGVCSVPETDEHLLVEAGVKDSKELSPKKRKELEQSSGKLGELQRESERCRMSSATPPLLKMIGEASRSLSRVALRTEREC